MRKIIAYNFITLDGFFAGENGELDWHNYDENMSKFSTEQMKTLGGLMFGRTTYDLMKNYWSTYEGMQSEPIVAEIMNSIPKIVFSKTLTDVEDEEMWKNVTLVHEIDRDLIRGLKQMEGKDLAIFGSGTIVQQLYNLDLIDEYRLVVNPIILGKGKPLFANIDRKMPLVLIDTKTFTNGNVLLYYQPKNDTE